MVRNVAADRAKTAAIAKYVKAFREELLRDIPDEHKVQKEYKRNELLRSGRARFSKEPPSVQQQYFRPGDIQELASPKRSLESGSEGDRERVSSKRGASHSSPRARPLRLGANVSPEKAPASSGSEGVRELGVGGVSNQDEVSSALYGMLSKLQQWFGHAEGTAVLAACYRIMPHAMRIGAPVAVKAAAILSLAAKMNHAVENKNLRKLWCNLVGSGSIENVKEVEQSIFEQLALDGLEGPYAKERLAMLAERAS